VLLVILTSFRKKKSKSLAKYKSLFAECVYDIKDTLNELNIDDFSDKILEHKGVPIKVVHTTTSKIAEEMKLADFFNGKRSVINVCPLIYGNFLMLMVEYYYASNEFCASNYDKLGNIIGVGDTTQMQVSITREKQLLIHVLKPTDLEFYSLPKISNVKSFYSQHKNQFKMDSEEFDKAFPCVRSNETDFRVLFSPLAQEQFLQNVTKTPYKIRMKNGVLCSLNLKDDIKKHFTLSDSLLVGYSKENIAKNLINAFNETQKIIDTLMVPFDNLPLYESKIVFDKESKLLTKSRISSLEIEEKLNSIGEDIFKYPKKCIKGMIKCF
jgi:hypothetical protein